MRIKNKSLLIVFFLLSVLIVHSVNKKIISIKLGHKIDKKNLIKEKHLTAISLSEIVQLYTIEKNDITYRISINDKDEIEYISVSDTSFVTIDGIKINMQASIVEDIVGSKFKNINGFCFEILIRDGWFACIMIDDFKKNKDKSKIRYLYKKRH